MADLQRELQLPHSAANMYEIVADVGAYPDFLPWLEGVEVLQRSDEHIEAALQVARAGAHTEYITRYGLEPADRIQMELVEGPMHRLTGVWRFRPAGDGTSLLALDLDYEFSNPLFAMLFGHAFRATIEDMLSHVAERADELHRR